MDPRTVNSKLQNGIRTSNKIENEKKSEVFTNKKMDKNPYNSLVLESSNLKNRSDSISQKFDGRISGRESKDIDVGTGGSVNSVSVLR